MSLHATLRAKDRARGTKAMTAWVSNDREALSRVLDEANDDPDGGVAGLVFALLGFCDWLTLNTGPLTDQPEDRDPRDDPPPS